MYGAADTTGFFDPALDGSSGWFGWKMAGGTTNSHSFDATRSNTGNLLGVSFFRNRTYDQRTGMWTQEDPSGIGGGLNLYQYSGNNPVMFSDPFGLCPPQDNEQGPQCDVNLVGFGGVQGSAYVGIGLSLAFGAYHGKEGSGLYLRGSVGAGLDVAVGVEGGGSRSLKAFKGGSHELCGGVLGGGGCASTNSSGLTVSGGVSVGTRDLPIPVSTHGGGGYTATLSLTAIVNAVVATVKRYTDTLATGVVPMN